jgi:hypothetical protein
MKHPLAVALAATATTAALAQPYAVEFVATAASATVMDPSGSIIAGTTALAPACATCPPTFGVPAIWAGGQRFLLTLPPGKACLSFAGINAHGWVAGTAWDSSSTVGMAMVWRPQPGGTGFDAIELGTLPGLASSSVAGIDDQSRVVGLSNTWFGPADPMMWTAAGGMVSLTAMGHVGETPLAISPAGTVATLGFTYTLGAPSSTTPVAPAPAGFGGTSATSVVVNDGGDRALAMLTTSSSSLRYPFRYHATGAWQQIGAGTGDMSIGGLYAIDSAATIIGTALSAGYRAAGPDGLAVSLSSLLSPAYGGASVSSSGDLASDGSIVASTFIGRSPRLTRLVPVAPCTGRCLRVNALNVTGRMISERGKPGECTPKASNRASAALSVVDEQGVAVSGATISGRFLDDDYLDTVVTVRTNLQGRATAQHQGPACVGAIAFFVDRVVKTGLAFDRSSGVLTGYVIPQP